LFGLPGAGFLDLSYSDIFIGNFYLGSFSLCLESYDVGSPEGHSLMSADSDGRNKEHSNESEVESHDSFPASQADKFLVVGIGASAGGIHALKEFFSNVPDDSGMAYVVILHLSPEHESRLAEILQVGSPIPVTQVKEREKIQPDHVYVIPPNQNLSITDGHLVLTNMIGLEERRSPVDLFFRTLAEANESRAVSVILSGTGSNGSIGMKRIKECGGIAFAQHLAEAEYPDMPRNAISTGMVDYVLPVAQIPARIISYKDHLNTVQVPEPAEQIPKTDEQALLNIFTQLRLRTGNDFSNYKRGTILRRIERRLGLRELSGFAEYARYLREQPDEADALMKDLLISVTNFFRDSAALKALAARVIPKIFEARDPGDPIRVWAAGSATGEEAYSIAMLLSEHISHNGGNPKIQIFATDLDQSAIQIAREGFYSDAEVTDLSAERLRTFFSREAGGYRVRRELRESILFAVHNVIKDPPFSHLDLICCRNLLIYLNRSAQDHLLEVFHFALNPSAYLFLGASESIDGAGDLFHVIDKEHRIYRSRPVPPRAFPIPEVTLRPAVEIARTTEEKRAIERLSYADLHQRLLEQYASPSVIVNEEYDIIHLSDHAGIYMQMPGGEPSHNLLQNVRPELRLELRTALYQAVRDRINVEAHCLRVRTEQGPRTINIKVRPVLGEEELTRGFILVLFEETDPGAAQEQAEAQEQRTGEPIAHRLEEELAHSKAHLQATIEQYEIQQEELRASNEELQAMNEELRSAAEELETSKEELQSVNEEITTVNQELKTKLEEFTQANKNVQNLLNSTNIGTIFIDRNLRVRHFTPSAREAYNLMIGDIDRPLLELTNRIGYADLMSDAEAVLKSGRTVEREVSSDDGRTYAMKLFPYRTLEGKTDGVVITFVDVSTLTHLRDAMRDNQETLEQRVTDRTRELATAHEALKGVVERATIEVEHTALLAQLVTAQEVERRRLARDLHDQLGQRLTLLRLRLESLKSSASDPKQVGDGIEGLLHVVKQLDTDVDFLAWQLRPVALDDLGLDAALENYVKEWSQHFNLKGQFRSGDSRHERLPQAIETNLYRIAQEALNNCAKHSKCTRAELLLENRDGALVLIIEDDGIGFDPDKTSTRGGHLGLIGMRERAILLNGELEVESEPGKGTTIFVRVPLSGNAVNEDDQD
jgi:two-component system, chemotaxis family, CheB/CheR fusion protein